MLRLHAPVKNHMGEGVLGHPPPCFLLCTGRSAPVLVLLLLLVLILVLLILLVLLLLILVLLIFTGHRGTSFRICDTASVCPESGGAYIRP